MTNKNEPRKRLSEEQVIAWHKDREHVIAWHKNRISCAEKDIARLLETRASLRTMQEVSRSCLKEMNDNDKEATEEGHFNS